MAEDRRQSLRRRTLTSPRLPGLTPTGPNHLFVRSSLWQTLGRDSRHPVARHLSRQLKRGRRLRVLPLSLAWALPLLALAAYAYYAVDEAVGWTLPLFLMLFSALHCVVWIARIVALLSRQARSGAMDEVGVIPAGRVFIYLTICKLVLNEDDALYWLGLLRRVLAGGVFLMLILSLCIAATQMDQVMAWDFAAVFVELALFALVIQLEHTQSAMIACLLAIVVGSRPRAAYERTGVVVAGFILLQILSYSLALAVAAALGLSSLSIALGLFLLSREVLILLLWRVILREANEDNLPLRSLLWPDALRRNV